MDVNDSFWMREFAHADTVVVANGEIPASDLSKKLLGNAKRIVCCDGALRKLLGVGITPDAVVGDGDSMDTNELEAHNLMYYPDKSKEYNDLQKALKYCISNSYDNILLLGCGGLREDHFIANLSIMAYYLDRFTSVAMLTEHGVFNVFRGEARLNCTPGMQVSVFVKNPDAKMTFKGLRYPVEKKCFSWLWEGSLNEAIEENIAIYTENNTLFAVFRAR